MDSLVSLSYLSLSGTECDGILHNQPVSLWLDVLLLQLTTGSLHVLAPTVDSWRNFVSIVSFLPLWSHGCIGVHCFGNYHKSLRNDRTSSCLSKVSPTTNSFVLIVLSLGTYTYIRSLKLMYDVSRKSLHITKWLGESTVVKKQHQGK
jgi:hypothetical protein